MRNYAWHEIDDIRQVIQARRDEAAADGQHCQCVHLGGGPGQKNVVSATSCGYHDADLERVTAWRVRPRKGVVAAAPGSTAPPGQHYRRKCRVCGDVYAQCRCPGPKRTEIGICPACVVKVRGGCPG